MTDAERLEEVRAWASVTRPEDDDGPTFFLLNRGDRLEAEVKRLRKAIQTVLDDNETGAGGWGPDVTMAEILRVAMEGES